MKPNPEEKRRLLELIEKKNEKEFAWFRGILMSASSLLGLVIALHRGKSESGFMHIMYATTLVSLAIGILLAGIYLYAEPKWQSNRIADWVGDFYGANDEDDEATEIPRWYTTLRTVALVAFALGLSLLVTYAVLADQ